MSACSVIYGSAQRNTRGGSAGQERTRCIPPLTGLALPTGEQNGFDVVFIHLSHEPRASGTGKRTTSELSHL